MVYRVVSADQCKGCGGSGGDDWASGYEKCEVCSGTGEVVTVIKETTNLFDLSEWLQTHLAPPDGEPPV